MANGDQMGGRSVTTIYKREQDKLANQFLVSNTKDLYAGQPVALKADGTIEELSNTNKAAYLGINLYDVKKGEVTTVMILVSHVMLYAQATETLKPADLVVLAGVAGDKSEDETSYDYSNHLSVSKATASAYAIGICLDTAAVNANEVRVLVFDKQVDTPAGA